jgi:hypothetical protein
MNLYDVLFWFLYYGGEVDMTIMDDFVKGWKWTVSPE